MKEIFDLINFVGVGGWTSLIGGFIGYWIGHGLWQNCSSACSGSAFFGCVKGCPDPWLYAAIFALPGIVIWGVQKIKNKQS